MLGEEPEGYEKELEEWGPNIEEEEGFGKGLGDGKDEVELKVDVKDELDVGDLRLDSEGTMNEEEEEDEEEEE